MKKIPFGLSNEDMKRLHKGGIEFLISADETVLRRGVLTSFERDRLIKEIEELKKLFSH